MEFSVCNVYGVISNDEVMLWDDKGTDFSTLITDVKATSPPEDYFAVLERELTYMYVSPDKYQPEEDYLWTRLSEGITRERQLSVYTYGSRFKIQPPVTQQTFDATCIRSHHWMEHQYKHHFRGTDLIVQQEVRYADNFLSFFRGLVSEIETHDLHTIEITCLSGHHRSVACAEFLRYIYPGISIHHLTINQ